MIVVAVTAGPSAQRRTVPAAVQWPTYNHDLAGTRFSPLTQINVSNVSTLAQAWTYQWPASGPPQFGGSEAVPIVVGGVMYLPVGQQVVALEADTGKEIWQHEVPKRTRRRLNRRGVSYWPGDRNTPERIFVTAGTPADRAQRGNGRSVAGFGTNGVVDTVVGYGASADHLQATS